MTVKAPSEPPHWFLVTIAWVQAEWTKVVTIPIVWTLLTVSALVNLLLGFLTLPDFFQMDFGSGKVRIDQISMIMIFPMYIFVGISAYAFGSEFRGGQLRESLLAMPHRPRFVMAKYVSLTIVSILGSLVAVVPGYVIRCWPAFNDGSVEGRSVLSGCLALVFTYLMMGYLAGGIAVLTRSAVMTITLLMCAPMIASPVLQSHLGAVVRVLPHEVVLSVLQWNGGQLAPRVAITVLTMWSGAAVFATLWAMCYRTTASGVGWSE